MAQPHIKKTPDQLSMVLWQYGFINLGQLY
ncbi:DUF2949 domain-containing protein [Cyanobacterium stanieri LEGE 03274]|uniref:DUF2949 domain-containing protein n=1 Tax=Cyanobacterium stanieri LEGE 03274 TaxID=1828756 RepID=A0ABR9V079_9CHRO|nr:DUF2949 domain-containing protein [Cyanobacterium stanieri LEGE 03274]